MKGQSTPGKKGANSIKPVVHSAGNVSLQAFSAPDSEALAAPPDTPAMAQEASLAAINKAIRVQVNTLEFPMDNNAGGDVVKAMDTKTNKVLRQFASAEVMTIARELEKCQ